MSHCMCVCGVCVCPQADIIAAMIELIDTRIYQYEFNASNSTAVRQSLQETPEITDAIYFINESSKHYVIVIIHT